ERDLRRHLRDHDEGTHTRLEPWQLAEQDADECTCHHGDREADQDLRERGHGVRPDVGGREEPDELLAHRSGWREQERVHLPDGDDQLPDDDDRHDEHGRHDPGQDPHDLLAAHQFSSSMSWRSLRTISLNSGVVVVSTVRGFGSTTGRTWRTRPGRGVMCTTRSARNTASGMSWVTKTTVDVV